MIVHRISGRNSGGYTTFGGVWEKGEVKSPFFILRNMCGEEVPVQSRVMAWWPDGSIKWSAHTADSDKMGERAELLPYTVKEREEETQQTEKGIRIEKRDDCYQVDTGIISIEIPRGESLPAKELARGLYLKKQLLAESIYPTFCLERRFEKTSDADKEKKMVSEVQEYQGEILSVNMEETGKCQTVFCFRGNHIIGESAKMPFVIRLYLCYGSRELKFVHTFLYDGIEKQDFLKGMGLRYVMPMNGRLYNRHIQFGTDGKMFHEQAILLCSNKPSLSPEIFTGQQEGKNIICDVNSDIERAAEALPVWQRYTICQDSAYHYAIKKRTGEEYCSLVCRQGHRSSGIMAVSDEQGAIVSGIRDFWQKYPSGLEVNGLGKDTCYNTIWFHSPEAESFDFRHYDGRSYPESCYEGFKEVGASAYGIGVTSECRLLCCEKIPAQSELEAFGKRLQKPPVYVADPEYYHQKRAFGYWSFVHKDTEAIRWLEAQLDKAFCFYQEEIEARDWYGLFDYGDVMHTYDNVRHCWKYDVGGFAWQNTELVPTYWLWLYFLRTGREDVFTMAEAMSRHCSEVDVYHFGTWKGLGSRHNVRHWGCSCKEPRIAMAGHHRFLYYLTGDLRLGDVMDEVKDADISMAKAKHFQALLPDGSSRPSVRSGPDWSSLVSNWMTAYERTLNQSYRKKIETGISDIAGTPFGLISGPDFYYNVDQSHLIYHGEREDTPNQHLQICMGGPQIWLEVADMLENERLKDMLVNLGSFYLLSKEEKAEITAGRITNRSFGWPMLATAVTGYAGMMKRDEALALETWKILFDELVSRGGTDGYAPQIYEESDGKEYKEIPWITTNRTAQWCLNIIMCQEFIGDYLKDSLLFEAEGI